MAQCSGRLRNAVVFATACSVLFSIADLGQYTAHADDSAQQRCDELAGSPHDPSRVGPGVRFSRIRVTEALPACQAAANAAPVQPQYQFLYGRVLQAAGRYKEAFQQYSRAAEGGIAAAMTNLGVMYENGLGVAQSDADAVAWYRKAAEAGSAKGMHNLGWMYEIGAGVAKSHAEALAWYRRAADARRAEETDRLAAANQKADGGAANNSADAAARDRTVAEDGNGDNSSLWEWAIGIGLGLAALSLLTSGDSQSSNASSTSQTSRPYFPDPYAERRRKRLEQQSKCAMQALGSTNKTAVYNGCMAYPY